MSLLLLALLLLLLPLSCLHLLLQVEKDREQGHSMAVLDLQRLRAYKGIIRRMLRLGEH
jgi:hypothetical protein